MMNPPRTARGESAAWRCKKDSIYGLLLSLALVFPAPVPGSAQGAVVLVDTGAIRREMKQSASSYEQALRRSAPFLLGGSPNHCDERVGRFCLSYDSGDPPVLPAEPPAIRLARQRVIAAHRRGLAAGQSDSTTVVPLVRYLIEADSADAALTVARGASLEWSELLQGLVHFQRRRMDLAEPHFERVVAQLDPRERTRALDPAKLLAPRERGRFERLDPPARADYEARLWRLADPLYLTPGNDAFAEHLARYAWSRILSRTPVVLGSTSWGWDVEELTRRFGPPHARTQDYGRGAMGDISVTEHFNPEQRTYVPPELSTHSLSLYLPGGSWPYDTIRSRNGFAPTTVRAMRVLEHQASRFPASGYTQLRVDGELMLDSLARLPTRVEWGLFILDSAFRVVAQQRATGLVSNGRVRGSLEVAVPADAYAYSFEARELGTRQSARARHLLAQAPALISDPVLLDGASRLPVSRADPAFSPLPTLTLVENAVFAVYLDVSGLTPTGENRVRYQVTLTVEETTRAGALNRAVRRLGRSLGIRGARSPNVTWSGDAIAAATVPIAFRIGDLRLKRGYHRLGFVVQDLVSGAQRLSERVVRIN